MAEEAAPAAVATPTPQPAAPAPAKSEVKAAIAKAASDSAPVRVSVADAILRAKEKLSIAKAEAAAATPGLPATAPQAPANADVPAEVKEPVKAPDKDLERSWEMLAIRERKAQQREAKTKELERNQEQLVELFKLKESDPIAFIEKLGLRVDDLARRSMNVQPTPEEKIARLEKQIAEDRQQRQQEKLMSEKSRQMAEGDYHLAAHKQAVSKLAADPRYAPVLTMCDIAGVSIEQLDEAYIGDYHNKHQVGLTPQEVLDRLLPEAQARVGRVASKFAKPAEVPTKQPAQQLDNRMAGPTPTNGGGMTWEEKKRYQSEKLKAALLQARK